MKKILIVDDFQYNLEFEERVIRTLMEEFKIKLHIDTALTVYEALKKIKENKPYDVLIVDMNLPDGSGGDIAKAAREKRSSIKIAALTIYPEKYQEYEELFDLFIRKPIMPPQYKEDLLYLLGLENRCKK